MERVWMIIVTTSFNNKMEVPKAYFYQEFEKFKEHLTLRRQRVADLIDKGGKGDVSYFEFDEGTWHQIMYNPLDL